MTSEKVSCLIIGSGPAGYTAAIYASRAGLNPVLYQGAQPGGQLTITTEVDNFPGYPDGVTGPEMMIQFENQARRFGTDIRYGMITEVDFTSYPHKVIVDGKKEIIAESVIVSTGASAKWLGIEGEERLNGHGVSACAVCDGFFFRGQDVVVVGAGDTAAEEASYLAKLARKVYLLVRRDEMRASKIMQKRLETLPNVEILWNTETVKLNGEHGLESVEVRNNKTGEETVLNATGFFVAIGHKPNTDIFKGYLNMDETGYIQTIPGSSCTNIKGVFACGDAQDNVYRQAVTAAGTGCMAALDAERFLMEHEVEVMLEESAS
ncbi:thioredoxin-disulfide reductase [Dyadobacter luteus]|jgi:thioredoxin reductase (NADPH)|uniref:Thioredoxin reductase n=1 Tax=Dyadobacter luteus TaxID=2259619 RepID=A0A3D8YFS8_9BACT|nr:thioredoxin-disulfide reductase [Dyadobacter luteus]REA63517.1 thioredoxin-disulfide reductase [Dyadobacter luteus]